MQQTTRNLLILAFFVLTIGWRLLPYWQTDLAWTLANISPLAALALFAGSHLAGNRWLSFGLPLGAFLLSDIAIHAFAGMELDAARPFYYLFFAGIVVLGMRLGAQASFLKKGAAVLGGSVAFFLFSNLLVWLGSSMYAPTLAGLVECYAMAVPFFHKTLLGDTGFALVFFGVWQWLAETRQATALAK